MLRRVHIHLLIGCMAAAFAIAGCGGDDDSTDTAAQAQGSTVTAPDGGDGDGEETTDSKGGSKGPGDDSDDAETVEPDIEPVTKIEAPPRQKGGDNSIQDFGEEADDTLTAEVVAGLRGYLDARAAGDYERACAFMAGGFTEQIGQLTGPEGETLECPELLEGMSAGLSKQVLKDLKKVEVGSVRVDGERAFVIFKGHHNLWMVNPMALEDDIWKSAALAPSNLP